MLELIYMNSLQMHMYITLEHILQKSQTDCMDMVKNIQLN